MDRDVVLDIQGMATLEQTQSDSFYAFTPTTL